MAGWSDGWLLLFGGRIDGDGWMDGLMDVWWVGGWSLVHSLFGQGLGIQIGFRVRVTSIDLNG